MASTSRPSDKPEPPKREIETPSTGPHSDAERRGVVIDDTVPAVSSGEEAPVRPTIPLDRYRLGTELGRGGMGRVVEAFDVQLGRTVALKEVLTKGTHRRFAREIHITARLEHASIVPLYDSGISMEGKPFYVMRKVTGKPLDEMVAKCRDLDERLTLLPSLLAAIDAVAHAHGRGIIHRDLKPQNILVGERGETVVIDWGLAKVVGEDEPPDVDTHVPSAADSLRTQVGSVFGTPGFMAPEQARGEALDTQGDVYALGATLYQLLSGEPPVRGHSATEVMDKTRTHDIRPLAETAPGAPPDLVAIVAKALAFDPNNRYRDATELALDVRRFLDGQLVAAHDYTKWQRISRFGRKYRGVVSVTAIATVAVAVMAWIGVHRILTERDAANVARGEADVGKREAEVARDRLAEQRDALLVMQARGRLATNPTEALAILKQLPASSARADEARAIGRAAIMRGAAWAIQTGSELTVQAEMSADGSRLLQVSSDGMVRVFDLDLRRMIVSRSFANGTRATWISGSKLLVTNTKAQPQIVDPITGDVESLGLEPMSMVETTAAGDRAIVKTAAKTPALFDVAARTLTPIPFTEKLEGIEIASDGSWYAVYSEKLIIVFGRDGTELTRRQGFTSVITGSRMRTLAVLADKQMFECVLDPKPVWTEIPVPARPIWFVYRGRELDTFHSDGTIQGWKGVKPFRRGEFDRMTPFMLEVADDVLVLMRDDGDLHWISEFGRGTLPIPSVINRARLAGRPGVSRVAVVADGVIVVYDLAASMPRRIAGHPHARAVFVDDGALLLMREMQAPWEWFDLATGKTTSSGYNQLYLPELRQIDPIHGRVLLRELAPQGPRFLMLRKNTTRKDLIAEGEAPWAHLLPGDALVYGLGDGQVFAKIGEEPARMVAKVDGVAQQAIALGPLRFAVHSSSGEVVRVDLRANSIERVRVPVGTNGFVATDSLGRVLIAGDTRLMLWDGQVTEIAKFDRTIYRIIPVEGGVAIIVGKEREIYMLEIKQGATPHRLFGASMLPMIARGGKLMAGMGNAREITIVELPSRVRWTLPMLSNARDKLDVSPSGSSILQTTDSGVAVWKLPRVGADYATWLDERTNAVVDRDGVLVWPWQKRP